MAKTPTTWTFELVLSGFNVDFEEATDALFEAGCDDALLSLEAGKPRLAFDRDATSLDAAVSSAIADVSRANVGATVIRVEPDDMVNAAEIARRASVSREAVRLWISGERGDGDFPPPVANVGKSTAWSWLEVASWLGAHGHPVDDTVLGNARFFAALNRYLAIERTKGLDKDVERIAKKIGHTPMIARLRQLRTDPKEA